MPHKSWKKEHYVKVKNLPNYDPKKKYKCSYCDDDAFYFNRDRDALYCGPCSEDAAEGDGDF